MKFRRCKKNIIANYYVFDDKKKNIEHLYVLSLM